MNPVLPDEITDSQMEADMQALLDSFDTEGF
jgi:hypothetical protein